MEYRQHHDFNVSEIGVGCYALSGVYGKKDIPAFKAMLTRAYELGVNFFDTAEAYGDAECILDETVKPFRKDIYIATKVGSGEGTKPSLNQQSVRAACERSLKLLDTDYIDLYQVHFDDPDTPLEETLAAACLLLTGRFSQAASFEPGDVRNFDPLFQRERLESGRRTVERFARLARKYQKTPAQAAITWVLAQPGVICTLVGPSTTKHLQEDIAGSSWNILLEDLDDSEDFFKVEQTRLQEAQITSVKQIVSEPLPEDNQLAFVDLVYACENAILTNLVSEDRIMPVFYDLFGLRKSLDRVETAEKLAEIQKELYYILNTPEA